MAWGRRIVNSTLCIAWILASAGLSSAFLSRKLHSIATMSAVADDGASPPTKAAAQTGGDNSPSVNRYESPFLPRGDSGVNRIPSALILLNTPIAPSGAADGKLAGVLGALWDASSYRVCADGGANRLYDATAAIPNAETREGSAEEYLPDVITGDLDSVREDVREYYEARGVAVVRVEDQNHHDLDKSLMAVKKWMAKSCSDGRASRTFIYGAFGGRFDQEMGCVNAICVWGKKEAFARATLALYNEETCAFALKESPATNEICLRYPGDSLENEEQSRQVGEGPTCGLIPILGRCEKVITTGLKWNLEGDVPLEFGGLVSSSNRALDDVVTVETSSPMLFTAEMIVKHR